MALLMKKPNKSKQQYTKKELDKIRKQTGACEHDQVNYKSLEELNEVGSEFENCFITPVRLLSFIILFFLVGPSLRQGE